MDLSPAQNLPPEVVDFIVDGNHGDRKTLSSCSLVCKSWLPSSRYGLFSGFDVYVGPNVGASFLKLLEHPLCTIIYCIRSVSIYPGLLDQHGVASLGEKTIAGLAKLTHVNSLRIHNHRGRVPKATLDLLGSIFSEVTILRTANPFPSFNDAIDFLALFPLLKSLEFNSWCINATLTAPDIRLPSTLHTVHLHSPFTHGAWFSQHRSLESLTLSNITSKNIPVVHELLTGLGSNLLHLCITFPRTTDDQSARDFFAKVNFISNTRLSSLKIKTLGNSSSFLLSTLQSLRTPNLEALTWETEELRDMKEWNKVDARVSDRLAFKRLKLLHFVRPTAPTTTYYHYPEPSYQYHLNPPPILNLLPQADALGIKITERRF